MKLRPIRAAVQPEYPAHEDFAADRRRFLQRVGAVASLALAAGALGGCSPGVPGSPPPVVPAPDPPSVPPEAEAPTEPPEPIERLRGDVAEPEPPQATLGRIRAPEKPNPPVVEKK